MKGSGWLVEFEFGEATDSVALLCFAGSSLVICWWTQAKHTQMVLGFPFSSLGRKGSISIV